MRENCLSYNEIVDYFGEKTLTDRYRFIHDKLQEYIGARGLEESLYIHEGILQQAVMDYFVDIYRLKEFHKIDKVDIAKIMAYQIYWLLRRKPLQAAPNCPDSKLVFANEGFATTLIAHECLIPATDEPMSQEEEEYLLEYLRHLNYHFKYRNLDKQDLELMIYAFQTGKRM